MPSPCSNRRRLIWPTGSSSIVIAQPTPVSAFCRSVQWATQATASPASIDRSCHRRTSGSA